MAGQVMELIDVVTEDGIKTGKIKSREEVHTNGDWHKTVHIWIANKNKEILLQKRVKTKESHPGLWDIACAGHISANETSVQAALKELEEELGIQVVANDLTFLFAQKASFLHNKGEYIDNEIHEIYLLSKEIPLSAILIQKSEVESVKYVSFKTFCNRVHKNDPTLVPHNEEYKRVISILKKSFENP